MEEKSEKEMEWKSLTEGQATILYPPNDQVFYNKVQVFNRDLSILVLTQFSEIYRQEKLEIAQKKNENGVSLEDIPGISILEALSATGLRSIRYFKEIPNVSHIVANDISETAVDSISRNILHNGLSHSQIQPNLGDASIVMYQHRDSLKRFDVVDLDPYGAPTPFVDAAVQSVADGGLLCITATDMPVLCGKYPEVCFSKYASLPHRKKYCHEMALRILLNLLETTANRYKHIVPQLCVSVDFYIRMFVRVYSSPLQVKYSPTKLSHLFQCCGCDSFEIAPLARYNGKNFTPSLLSTPTNCQQCDRQFKIGGPIWSERIHDVGFVSRLLQYLQSNNKFSTSKRLQGVLTAVSEEIQDSPLFMDLQNMCSILHCVSPPLQSVKDAITQANYEVSMSHTCPTALKTNAPQSFLWDILRNWTKSHPVSRKNLNSPGSAILEKDPQVIIELSEARASRKRDSVSRFMPNPEENWGPKARAKARNKRSCNSESSDSNQKRIKQEDREEKQEKEDQDK